MTGSTTIAAAERLLKSYNGLAPLSQEELRRALQTLAAASDYQTLGVCAETAAAAFQALEHYLHALGYNQPVDPEGIRVLRSPVAGAGVFLKFNTRTGSGYVDVYAERQRGVLITYQSDYDVALTGTYGHFPLDPCA